MTEDEYKKRCNNCHETVDPDEMVGGFCLSCYFDYEDLDNRGDNYRW